MRITVHRLKVVMSIGVHDWERRGPQEVFVTLMVDYDATRAVTSDRIADALDYDALATCTRQALAERHYDLVETAAQVVLERLQARFASLTYVRVAILKPHAIEGAEGVEVALESFADPCN